MADGSHKDSLSEPIDKINREELRAELHTKVQRIFERENTDLDICMECLSLASHLITRGAPYIDWKVGREIRGRKSADALIAGESARDEVKAASHGANGKTMESSANVGLIGSYVTVTQLAAYTDDTYLNGLAGALRQLRLGQVHPWLIPPKTPVHPRQHADDVLAWKAIPFTVIEYLVSSGLYATKTDATTDVLAHLGVSEDTLRDWRKQQRTLRAARFDLELEMVNFIGPEIRKVRSNKDNAYVDLIDELYGLPALHGVTKALKELGAHKGQK